MPYLRVLSKMREQHVDMIERWMEGERVIADRLAKEAKDIPVRDLAGAGRNAATSVGIHTDKLMDLTDGEAPKRLPSLDEVLRGLAAKGITGVRASVDVTAGQEPEPPKFVPQVEDGSEPS